MRDSYPEWKCLPAEIILDIFKADKFLLKYEVYNYALVCKAWLNPAQSIMYSNVNCIKNLSQLRKFANTVEHNASLGEMVKIFGLVITYKDKNSDTQEKNRVEILELLTTLVSDKLPNLETVRYFYTLSYAPILQALTNSRLKRLKVLDPPVNNTEKREVDNYVKCALLMNDRLENITILRDDRKLNDSRVERLPYHRLYKELHRFENLLEIYIRRKTSEEVETLEYVVESCKSLNKLNFDFDLPNDENTIPPQNYNTFVDAISNITPRPDIKELNCLLNASSRHKMLLYIMKKFPQLGELYLEMTGIDREISCQYTLNHLLHYLLKINRYNVKEFTVDLDAFAKIIASFWNATSKPGSQYVKIRYSVWLANRRPNIIGFEKTLRTPRNGYTSLTFPLSATNFEWKHIYFLQQSGMYLRELQLNLGTSNVGLPENWELPKDFLMNILVHCPNLENLYLVTCVMKQAPYTTNDLNTKFSLVELYLNECQLHPGMLGQASLLLHKIRKLSIGHISYKSQFYGIGRLDLEIIMPHTHIDTIAFQKMFPGDNVYLMLYVINHNSHYYYQLDSEAKEFMAIDSNTEEFLSANGGKRIQIVCLNKPTFCIELPRFEFM